MTLFEFMILLNSKRRQPEKQEKKTDFARLNKLLKEAEQNGAVGR